MKTMNFKTLSYLALVLVPGLALTTTSHAQQTEAPLASPQACGIVSVYKNPPKTKRLYRVVVDQINGQAIKSNSHTFVLPVGKHKIKVMENIDDSFFARRRGEMLNYKYMDIEVEANKAYYLGAKYNRKYKSKLRTGEYWDAVVWKQKNKSCTM